MLSETPENWEDESKCLTRSILVRQAIFSKHLAVAYPHSGSDLFRQYVRGHESPVLAKNGPDIRCVQMNLAGFIVKLPQCVAKAWYCDGSPLGKQSLWLSGRQNFVEASPRRTG